MPRRTLWTVLLLLTVVLDLLAAGDTIIRGRLADPPGQHPPAGHALVFVTDQGQKLALEGDEYSTSQLTDPELEDRYWELRGHLKPSGVFEVMRLFTVKDDKLFRVTYFCVICNIRSHHHGPCMCCQDETELQELPVAEP